MDHPEITAIEWCFGAGGNHLGLRRVLPSLRLVAACEIEAYAVANVVAKMEAGLLDPALVWTDCRTFPCELFADRVALFIASYPCQPFSVAGKKKGHTDDRNLWPFVLAGVRAMRPMRCFFENVENHVSLGLSTVLSDLEEAGYRCAWGIFSAEECGAPHRRKRVFIMADADGTGFGEHCGSVAVRSEQRAAERSLSHFPPRPDQLDEWREVLGIDPSVEPALCRMADGLANRVDRLRLTGNGVVPDTAALAYTILDRKLKLWGK